MFISAPIIKFMSVRVEDNLQTIQELSQYSHSIPKACTVGVIIDSTNAYFDESKTKFVKKIKIVDDSFNTSKYSPHLKFPYLTVFFYAPRIDELPNPKFIGDVLYLRRFSFGKYNESFQGHYLQAQYCSWALINGDSNSNDAEEYQASKIDMNLKDEKYQNLASRIKTLRKWARGYLSTTSILSILPTGIVPKDTDLIVQVTRRNEEEIRVSNGKQELILRGIVSFAEEGTIAKLRSIARIVKDDKTSYIVPNNFTSLIAVREWTYDSQKFIKTHNAMDIEREEDIFTTLAQLNLLPINECENKKYYVKVEVASVSTHNFVNALSHYDEKKRTLSDTHKKDTAPIYKFNFACLDESVLKNNKFSEIWLFSFDGKGSDFVERVNLTDLNEYSNYTEEGKYFDKRIEDILNADYVKMTVQVLSDGKGNKILRALSVN